MALEVGCCWGGLLDVGEGWLKTWVAASLDAEVKAQFLHLTF
jgi:hypothetical protein